MRIADAWSKAWTRSKKLQDFYFTLRNHPDTDYIDKGSYGLSELVAFTDFPYEFVRNLFKPNDSEVEDEINIPPIESIIGYESQSRLLKV